MQHLRTWFSGEHRGGAGLIIWWSSRSSPTLIVLFSEKTSPRMSTHPLPVVLTGGCTLHTELWSESSRPFRRCVGHSSSLCSLPAFMLVCKSRKFNVSLTNHEFDYNKETPRLFFLHTPGAVWAPRADFDPTPLFNVNNRYQEEQLYFSKPSYNNMKHVLKNNIIHWILKKWDASVCTGKWPRHNYYLPHIIWNILLHNKRWKEVRDSL